MAEIIWGILAVVAGLIFCFRGYLAMRTVIGVWGGFIGFAVGAGLVAMVMQEPPLAGPFGWTGAIVGAVLFGGLAYSFYAVAVILAVGSVGYGLGASVAGLFTTVPWLLVLFGVIGAALLVVLALATRLPRFLLILVAASGGATAIIVGSLMVAGMLPLASIEPGRVASILESHLWLNVVYFVLFLAGVVTQLSKRSTADLRANYH